MCQIVVLDAHSPPFRATVDDTAVNQQDQCCVLCRGAATLHDWRTEMNKPSLFASLAICVLLVRAAVAAPEVVVPEGSRVLPVLVSVNAAGRVVSIDPAIQLRSGHRRALEKAIHTMITGPAMKNGRAVYSQFILQLALSADGSGKGGITYTYISSRPAPSGPLRWVHETGAGANRFALVPVREPERAPVRMGLPQIVPPRPPPRPPSSK